MAEVMTGPAIKVDVNTPLLDVMKCLEQNRIVRVPVLKQGPPVGIIPWQNVVKAALEPEFIAFGWVSSQLFWAKRKESSSSAAGCKGGSHLRCGHG